MKTVQWKSMNNKTKRKQESRTCNWANDQSTWQEPPISIEPTQSYVSTYRWQNRYRSDSTGSA